MESQEKAFVSHIDASVFRGQVVEFIIKDKGIIIISVISVKYFRVNLKYIMGKKLGSLTNLIDR